MELIIYNNFIKKSNSTKRPESGNKVEVFIKQNTSIENPVFLIDGVDLTVNYCYAPSFNRYYFINDIVVGNNNIYELHCISDTLATFKDAIGNYTAYVERSASKYDNYVNDNAISMKQDIVNTTHINTNLGEYFTSSGCFLVRILAKNSDSVTGINTYVLTSGQMSTFINDTFNVGNYGDIFTEVADELIKAVFNPFDYIVSVSWIPFYPEQFAGTSSTVHIKLGWWELENCVAYPCKKDSYGIVAELAKPPRYYNDWRDYNPNFTKANIWINGVGDIELDPRELRYGTKLFVMYYVDCCTGQANAYLRSGDTPGASQLIASYPATLCAPVQLSQSSLNVQGVASNGLTSLAYASTGNALESVVAGVNTIMDLSKPTTRVIGSQGNRASITAYMDLYIELTHYGSKDSPVTVAGKPLCENVKISTLSGFVKCGGASLDIAGYGSDKDNVNGFLNSGFYYE